MSSSDHDNEKYGQLSSAHFEHTASDRAEKQSLESDSLGSKVDLARERRIIRKVDLKLIPLLSALYLLSFIDRTNIGVAQLSGLSTDLGLKGNQYNIALLVFFVGYIIPELPACILIKHLRPQRLIPTVMVIWGATMLSMAFVKDFNGLVAARFILGLAESPLFPSVCFYLSTWYPRHEMNFRISLFFSSATLAGAFGGLIAYGISFLGGKGGLAAWSWIFLIEGALTVVVGLGAFFAMQDFPAQSTFLAPEDKEFVIQRLAVDHAAAGDMPFEWEHLRSAFRDWRVFAYVFIYVTVATPLYALSLFIPIIIASLGTWTRSQSVLLSTPPFFLAFFITLTSAYYSDRIAQRGLFNIFWMSIALIGFIILLAVEPSRAPGVCYFALFLTVGGISPCISNSISWTGGNNGPVYKRATAMGLFFTFGNSGGIIASTVYIAADSPRYVHGHGVMAAMCACSVIAASLLTWNLRYENARRNTLYGPASSRLPQPGELGYDAVANAAQMKRWGLDEMDDKAIAALGDRHPGFRYYP